MVWLGIVVGFCSALSQALSYVFSGMAVRRFRQMSALEILCRAHVVMGVLSLAGLPFVWTPCVVSGFTRYFPALLGVVTFYMLGQVGLFLTQRKVDSSRIVPLLGLKLVVLTLVNMFVLPLLFGVPAEHYALLQWLGIAATIGSAFLLNNAGGRIPWRSLCWILFTCVGYALSDTSIKRLMVAIRDVGETYGDAALADVTRASVLCVFIAYILGGVFGAILLPIVMRHRCQPVPFRAWGCIALHGVTWLVSMIFIYICFDMIGTVNGNLVQSTRGLLAIVMGWILAKAGCNELESRISHAVFLRRLLAGILMVLAVALFNFG